MPRYLLTLVDDCGDGAFRAERHRDPRRALRRATNAQARFSTTEIHELDADGRWRLVLDWASLGGA